MLIFASAVMRVKPSVSGSAVRTQEECGECGFLSVELQLSSPSAELIRTNASVRSSEPTVTISGPGWRRRRSSSPVCYGWRADDVGIMNIVQAPQQQHRQRRGSAIAIGATVFLAVVVNAGVFSGNKGHCGSFS